MELRELKKAAREFLKNPYITAETNTADLIKELLAQANYLEEENKHLERQLHRCLSK